MKFSQLYKRTLTLSSVMLMVAACSSKPEIKEFPKSANAKEEITNLEAALANSRSDNYDLLAPESYKEAQNSLKEARRMEKDDKSNEKVLNEVALGQAYLDRAKENAAENSSKLQDVIAARDEALAARADVLLPNELANLDKKVKEQTANLENDEDDKIKEKRSDFITSYRDLELAAIKKENIGESKFLIEKAIGEGARDLTPKTLAQANKDLAEADQYITQNRDDQNAIALKSMVAIESARQLEATVATARGLRAATPEETALRMQAEEAQLNRTQSELLEERGATAALAASNIEMEQTQKLNAIYEEARSKFTPEEADVYKQGTNLVIRLRSLQFPKSEAVLKGSDFALLKKVEDVIGSFDKSVVKVEGHTDSTGAKELNQKLSDERAFAVKQYLEANATDALSEIDSEGFGFEKPLASNKTPAGRAQNRRVDVVIEPVQL